MHNILKRLPKDEFEIHHLAINYKGDPHPFSWSMYPAEIGGNQLGYRRLPIFQELNPDLIFLFNDIWVVNEWLRIIKDQWKNIPPIVAYYPVDSRKLNPKWFQYKALVSQFCTYTDFGLRESLEAEPNVDVKIIPHGIDRKTFYKLNESKNELKDRVFKNRNKGFVPFIVLMCQRNQPRKRVDIGIKGFAKFVQDKPNNVLFYAHMGLRDAGLDLLEMARREGIDTRLVVSGTAKHLQNIPEEKLNLIYNASDVGLCTSTGDGWNLPCMEHAITGAPQVVPNHSAFTELYFDCGILVDPKVDFTNYDSLTEGALVDADDVAEALNRVYEDKNLYEKLSKASINKFSRKEYDWDYIVETQWLPLFREYLK